MQRRHAADAAVGMTRRRARLKLLAPAVAAFAAAGVAPLSGVAIAAADSDYEVHEIFVISVPAAAGFD